MAYFVFRYNVPSSTLAADDIAALIMVVLVNMAPLFGGSGLSIDRKKCPPTRLHVFFSLQYPASLRTANIILLALYDIIASSCVAQ